MKKEKNEDSHKKPYSLDELREMGNKMEPGKRKWLIRTVIFLGIIGVLSFGRTIYKVNNDNFNPQDYVDLMDAYFSNKKETQINDALLIHQAIQERDSLSKILLNDSDSAKAMLIDTFGCNCSEGE